MQFAQLIAEIFYTIGVLPGYHFDWDFAVYSVFVKAWSNFLMMGKLFGTDGVRGTANAGSMTPEMVLRIGMAAAVHFTQGDHRHRVVIGKDTRLSGYMLESALVAGFVSMGMDVILVGPLPTPAIAMLTRSLRADLGVMLSASHNLFYDNGIKLFGPDGYKLSDYDENKIESHLENGLTKLLSDPVDMGRARRLNDAAGRYGEYVKNTFPRGLRLDGLKVVVDCANGAAYRVGPEVLWELGADVISVNVNPDGFNINLNCGSVDTKDLSNEVINHRADIGIAFDGDADRVLICDECGNIIDGDQVMALIAADWNASGRLQGGGVVATVMSNLGFENYLNDNNLKLIRTKVGDRYVVEKMRKDGFNIGGEQSGHLVLSDYSTTGDGLISALQVLAILVTKTGLASEICRMFEPVPQILTNIKVSSSQMVLSKEVNVMIKEAEVKLHNKGRILIRKSGTEPLIRVMVEGEDKALINAISQKLVEAIERRIN